ncbi:hypothetical protein niasHS_007280 [Heterodera schachtii]|uniref:Uncharacterized protein n=1 Tax=Heterodera schachtii TaxID=97005 RepID=A0ABD2JJV4_HETSC
MTTEQQKSAVPLTELLSSGPCARSAWARKCQLLVLEGELSNGLELQLVEFDVALKFNEAKPLANIAQKIFQTDKSNEKVRQRIVRLFSILFECSDKKFVKELVSEFTMDTLQEMFFFAFPDQRNSTKGSLQVYLIWAINQPQSLQKIATKLFACYLGASGEYQQKCRNSTRPEEEVTPLDGVLFILFDSFVQADFGDLSLHNLLQLFHIILRNCFADSTRQLDDNFYSPSGFSLLSSSVPRPSLCWHFSVQLLSLLFARRGHLTLSHALSPNSVASDISKTLENAMANAEVCSELMRSAEFVRLVLCWTFVSPCIRNTQIAVDDQFVALPANVFSVTPSALQHFWLYNLETEDDDSPAEIEEPQQQQKTLRVNPNFLEPIRLLNSLFSSSSLADQQFATLCPFLHSPNARSVVVLALTVSENWKKASETLEHFEQKTGELSAEERSLLRVQQLQTLIRLRHLPKALALCIELLGQFVDFSQPDNAGELPPEFPLSVSRDTHWILLSHRVHLRLFLLLLLFHICWLAFAKCVARGVKATADGTESAASSANLFFLSLIVLAQSCWAHFGFGLFEQLCEHVTAADRFLCCDFFRYVSNAALMDELLDLDHVPMALCPDGAFLPTAEWRKSILEGKVRLAGKPALALLKQFLLENQQKMIDSLIRLF